MKNLTTQYFEWVVIVCSCSRVHCLCLQKVRMSELGDAVILDADKNTVQSQYDDLSTLPSDVVGPYTCFPLLYRILYRVNMMTCPLCPVMW